MKVLNFGSMNLDYVYAVDHMVMPGETQSSQGMEIFLGGKGFNQSAALAKAGVEVYQAGQIGEDGRIFLDTAKEFGIHSDYIKVWDGKTGHAIIQVDKNGQNCILLYGGGNRGITRKMVDEVLTGFDKGDILLLQNEINELDYIIEQAYAKGMQIYLNPSPFDASLDTCDMSKISCFLLNEIEGGQISGESEPEKIVDAILAKYENAKIVLTLGGEGSMYADKEKRCYQPIVKVEAVDTTAAGDTFTGYFIAGVLQGMSVEDTLKMCATASGIAVSRHGAAPSIPYMDEVKERLCNG